MKKIKDPHLFERIKEFLTVYLPDVRSKSINTIKSYRDALNLLLTFFKEEKGLEIQEITTDMITYDAFLEFLDWIIRSRGCGAATRNQRLTCLRSFYKYMTASDVTLMPTYIQLQQIENLQLPSNSIFKNMLSLKDISLILIQPDTRKKIGIRDQFYLSLLYDSGCRNQEILDLKLRDVHVKTDVSNILMQMLIPI